jgi:hypothetical protein
MAGATINGVNANVTILDKGPPAVQPIVKTTILQELVRISLAHVREVALTSNGRWLEQQYCQQKQ